MKITRIRTVLTSMPAASPAFRWRDGLPGSEPAMTGAWLVIETDEGITGFASTDRGVLLEDAVNRRLRSELLGQDPLARELLWHRVWEMDRIERFSPFLLGLVDVALWDIAAKQAGLPVYKLLGYFREKVPAYASTVTFSSVEEYLDAVDNCLELGFTAIKVHAWGDAKRDARLAGALRDRVGDDVPLMYDGSAGFDLPDAVYVGDALADAGFVWYEEPMKEFSVTSYRWLGQRVSVPLLLGEVSDGAHMSAGDFLATGVASGLRTSTFLRGGFTGAMRIAHLADAYNVRAEVHGGGLESTHLCMAIKNNGYYECMIRSVDSGRPDEVDENGDVSAPQAPGVGHEARWQRSGAPAELLPYLS